MPSFLSDAPLDLTASVAELCCGVAGSGLCAAYALRKHWLANNALGLAFSLTGIETLSMGSVQTGTLLLCGLFLYDIFWVFCTPVMVTVAKSFDAPIKLLFPRRAVAAAAAAAGEALLNVTGGNATAEGVGAGAGAKKERPFNMLGLGDIVVPGIFLALVLRMDVVRAAAAAAAGAPPPRSYFRGSVAGYLAGLGTTIGVMNLFNAAQPALLYIVPGVLVAVLGRAALCGEFAAVFAWSEEAAVSEEEKAAAAAAPWWQPWAELVGMGPAATPKAKVE